jgi:hypothetical protein
MKDEASYTCDSCGEEVVVPIDLSAGSSQEYVEDCPVCCRPNVIHVEIGDLARTSLPAVSPHWRTMLDDAVIVVVWHKTLKPNPRENTDHILAYYNKGLISEQGQSWVCWGDLRTEYIKTEELRDYLRGSAGRRRGRSVSRPGT